MYRFPYPFILRACLFVVGCIGLQLPARLQVKRPPDHFTEERPISGFRTVTFSRPSAGTTYSMRMPIGDNKFATISLFWAMEMVLQQPSTQLVVDINIRAAKTPAFSDLLYRQLILSNNHHLKDHGDAGMDSLSYGGRPLLGNFRWQPGSPILGTYEWLVHPQVVVYFKFSQPENGQATFTSKEALSEALDVFFERWQEWWNGWLLPPQP